MWMLSFIPDAWLHLAVIYVLFAGVGLYALSFFTKFIPPLIPYSGITRIVATILIVCGIYFYGSYSTEMSWRNKVAELEEKVKISEEKLEENVNSEPETFIVQNRTPGPHFVSDIKLNFDPEEVIDLTWEDPRTIKSSKDLRNSLRMGYLKKISQIEWDGILERQAIKDRNEIFIRGVLRTDCGPHSARGNQSFLTRVPAVIDARTRAVRNDRNIT